jgi:putative SOS response-associated peptidase YedK
MCGRIALDTDLKTMKEQFKVQSPGTLPKSFNVAPTEAALCLLKAAIGLIATQIRWGITLQYTQGIKPMLLINARAETVAEKPAFRQSLKHRRCLIIMSGFFEWQHQQIETRTVKQSYFIQRTDKKLMAVASVWDYFKPAVILTSRLVVLLQQRPMNWLVSCMTACLIYLALI